jgi:hypothetical protein
MIGRTKTVIVYELGDNDTGVISEVVARVTSKDEKDRLIFRGPVNFEESCKSRLSSIVLPVIDRITDALELPRRDFEISAVNLGVLSSPDISFKISGFSADLPISLALLSATLQVSLKQDVVSTGHIASIEGDLVAVGGIPAKLEAAIASADVSGFVFPDLDKDISSKLLTPFEYQTAKEALISHKGDVKIYSIRSVQDAIKIFMDDEAIVLGSLETGFFYAKGPVDAQNPIGETIKLLTHENEKRFWGVLEHALLNRDPKKARRLLQAYVDFHIQKQRYPENFGEDLFSLVISLPPSTRRLDDLFPLIPMERCITLTQHAGKSDHEDVRNLYNAAFGENFRSEALLAKTTERPQLQEAKEEDELVERLLFELSEENLSKKIGLVLDEARARYVDKTIKIKDGFEFNDSITAFYTHMFRHTGMLAGRLDKATLMEAAIELVEETFSQKGGYNAALSEGKNAINGGMRLVFNAMTEYLKYKAREKYIMRVFKEIMDPMDWDAKARLMKSFMKRIGQELPAELRNQPARKLARNWELIVRYYAEEKSKITDLLKRL